jgi:hypothetical protein
MQRSVAGSAYHEELAASSFVFGLHLSIGHGVVWRHLYGGVVVHILAVTLVSGIHG